jgi:uncharacterized protein
MKALHMAAFTFLVVGGVNWGLVGLMDYNFVESVLGSMPSLEKLVYVLVGVSAVLVGFTHKGDCKVCSGKKK